MAPRTQHPLIPRGGFPTAPLLHGPKNRRSGVQGGDEIQIFGNRFLPSYNYRVHFGSISVPAERVDCGTLVCVIPPSPNGAVGVVPIYVSNADIEVWELCFATCNKLSFTYDDGMNYQWASIQAHFVEIVCDSDCGCYDFDFD